MKALFNKVVEVTLFLLFFIYVKLQLPSTLTESINFNYSKLTMELNTTHNKPVVQDCRALQTNNFYIYYN